MGLLIRRNALVFSLAFFGLHATSCAISHSCSRAGDTHWPWSAAEQAERRMASCELRHQGGYAVIDGEYKEYFGDGKVALEGHYILGLKDGLWIQYDTRGNKVREIWFKKGYELDPSTGKHISNKVSEYGED